jgi:NAD(P)-dependent dehydrogenase (short-subunit alcohol dehydrogenase family)
MKIKNNTLLITGGSSGLGFATATMIIENEGNAVLLDIDDNQGKKVAEKLGPNCLFCLADVRSENDIKNALKLTNEKFGTISGLINCAGIGPAKRVVGKEGVHKLDMFQNTIDINLVGTFNAIRLVCENMQNNILKEGDDRGLIINTASVAAFDGQIGQAAYAASKGGIVAMTLPLARELARIGIRVMCIAPGIFETPMLVSMPKEAQESLGQQVPFPARLGKPSEFADLIKHIIENQMLNGEVIRLDGAIRMGAK